MAEASSADVVIVGAGIVGVCTAALLSEAGKSVVVVDRTGVVEETSSGNAAALAFSDMLPLAHKGMLKHLPGWLADPLGPLTIRPTYLPRLAPWLLHFLRAGSARHYESGVAAQAALMRLAETEMLALMDRSGTRTMLREDGVLELYDSEADFAAARPGYDLRERHGIAFEHLPKSRIAEYQDGLSDHFAAATFVPGWKTVGDPQLLGKALWAYAGKQGARFEVGEVTAVDAPSTSVTLADGRKLTGKSIAVCAGAWSHLLARQCGDRIPLEAERGYNTTLPVDAFDLKRQLVFTAHGFVVTPLETGIRVGGAVEFAGLKAPPNYARSRAMLEKAKRFMPGLKTEGGREWMGYRPSLPDSLPVIGRSSASPDIVYAFGHGHLGLTQSAATGRLIRDLVLGKSAAIDLAPYSAQRFV